VPPPLEKYFGLPLEKSPIAPLLEKIFPTPVEVTSAMIKERESFYVKLEKLLNHEEEEFSVLPCRHWF